MSPDLIQALKTLMLTGAVFSLVVAMLPILWGEIRAKWLLTGLTSCVTFGLAGLLTTAFSPNRGLQDPVAAAVQLAEPAAPVQLPWEDIGRAIGIIVAIYAAWAAAKAVMRVMEGRRRARARAAEARKQAVDPVAVAERHAPDMVDDVRTAMGRIRLLERIGADPANQVDADALVMARKRLPALMERLALALDAADGPDERAGLARTALRSVVDIGCMAEDARRGIADGLRDGLDTEARYIAQRTGRAAGELTAQ